MKPSMHHCLTHAGAFVRDYVTAKRRWTTETIASYMPDHFYLDHAAHFAGEPTVANVGRFMWEHAVHDNEPPRHLAR